MSPSPEFLPRQWPCVAATVLALVQGLAPAPACAAAAGEVVVTVAGYADEAGSYAGDATVEVPVGGGLALSGTVGLSHVESSFRLPRADSSDLSFVWGAVGARWSRGGFRTGLDASTWGDKDLARTQDLRVRAGYDWDRFSLSVHGVLRAIDARVRRIVDGQVVTETRSQSVAGYGAVVQLGLRENWWVYATGEDQRHDRTFPGIVRLRSGGVVGQRLLTLTSIFPDWFWSVGTDIEFGRYRLNVEYLADRSIFGELDTRTTSAAWRLPVGNSGDHFLDVRLGVSTGDASDSQGFGIVTYTGFW